MKPRTKFLIGGGGRRVLRFAAANVDIVGVNASIHSGEIDSAAAQDGAPERIDEKVEWVKDGAGDRWDDLEINAWLAAESPATPMFKAPKRLMFCSV